MASLDLSTIAQLLFTEMRSVDFARIVAELDAVLLRLRGKDVVITWDCDDMVTFDVPETRILLAWSETNRRGFEGCLTVSVGPNPTATDDESSAEHDVLCSRLVERIQGRFAPAAILWRQVEGSVGVDYIDDLVESLPEATPQNLPPIDSILDALSRADLQMAEARSQARHPRAMRTPELSRIAMEPGNAEEPARTAANVRPMPPREKRSAARTAPLATPAQAFPEASNDRPDLPLPKNAELARLREALYPVDDSAADAAPEKSESSTQMRLAVHCMNATLIVVYAPLGAAVMTYSILRGEDIRFSGRVMALAGTFFALANSPIGQTMAAVARSIS